jgi:3-hydroxyisobutyrate dehydrogenase-like beta-hydroxyacid dehydrogenase
VISLIEKLSDIKFKSDGISTQVLHGGVDETELLSLIDCAVMACNAVTVVECVEMGHRFGLPLSQMVRILNVGSAWSKVSEIILPASVSQSVPQLGCTIEKVKTALATLSGHASQIGMPLTLPNALLNTLHSTMRKPEEMATDFGAVCQFKFPLEFEKENSNEI